MQFEPLAVLGALIIKTDMIRDNRGSFSRVFCARQFAQQGLVSHFVQHSVSRSIRRGTLRGIHFQVAPFSETKVVRCVRGAIFDVIVDLRASSSTFRRWCGVELSGATHDAVYIPVGCAHGFQALVDDCEVEYLITPEYEPSAAHGIRWDDGTLGINWPFPNEIIISDKDRSFAAF